VQGKSENIPPQLAGELMRALLPAVLPAYVAGTSHQRIRSDGDINGIRVAMIKPLFNAIFVKD